jgi:hypothetical protein
VEFRKKLIAVAMVKEMKARRLGREKKDELKKMELQLDFKVKDI